MVALRGVGPLLLLKLCLCTGERLIQIQRPEIVELSLTPFRRS